jgi:hypothetical protein
VFAEILAEPELEFGGAGRHIDPRFGIANYGPADLDVNTLDSPPIRVGLVGPADQLDGLRRWLDRCRAPLPPKDERYPTLFPGWPGCDGDRGLHRAFTIDDRDTRPISSRDVRQIADADGADALVLAVRAYEAEANALVDQNRTDLLLIARPDELGDKRRPVGRRAPSAVPRGAPVTRLSVQESEWLSTVARRPFANFHDILKAQLVNRGRPIQVIRRSTWDESTPPPPGYSRQDEASRAWNLHVALYYKAGGVPWRLLRDARALTTCYVGVSFYRDDEAETLETAVAQVFNERGDGVIVRGGTARLRGEDRQPHLTAPGAFALLGQALDSYRLEHQTLPARLVVHKSSAFAADEEEGFRDAAEARDIAELELTWITTSESARLFRQGDAPPLRGTHVDLGGGHSALYTQGSIDFYSTYPGMYIPQPIGLRHVAPARSASDLAREALALTKMNWNQTRLDGKLPVTLRTAEQVKRILRFCKPDQAIAARYAYYM